MAEYVTVAPLEIAGALTGCSTGVGDSTVQSKRAAALPPRPSLASTVTSKVPAVDGAPVITPLAAEIDVPGGNPVAENDSRSPSGSLAETAMRAATPCSVTVAAGDVATGARLACGRPCTSTSAS